MNNFDISSSLTTHILAVDIRQAGSFKFHGENESFLEGWDFEIDETSLDGQHLKEAADRLSSSDVPVAFPTETVYGLGADASRSAAVQGIYRAKQRPSDNPLIVHISDLPQIQRLLNSSALNEESGVPSIYKPLIERFWPGPLTILLPIPKEASRLCLEVTAGLKTVGVRMPNSLIGLALIKLSDKPLAAPSANASTRPSPTTAQHVFHDLRGRIELIVDGGPCQVGVESTVVDGLSDPPTILRPGGVSVAQLRQCQGWENVQIAYKDRPELGSTPKAPGMKYKHYSPSATVILFEEGAEMPTAATWQQHAGIKRVGIVRTKHWPMFCSMATRDGTPMNGAKSDGDLSMTAQKATFEDLDINLLDVGLGSSPDTIARGLFSALRLLDEHGANLIVVEGINDDGDVAAAIMNRLRKAAASEIVRNRN